MKKKEIWTKNLEEEEEAAKKRKWTQLINNGNEL